MIASAPEAVSIVTAALQEHGHEISPVVNRAAAAGSVSETLRPIQVVFIGRRHEVQDQDARLTAIANAFAAFVATGSGN